MIRMHKNLIPCYVVAKFIECEDDCQELFFDDCIIQFSSLKILSDEVNSMFNGILLLAQHSSYGMI